MEDFEDAWCRQNAGHLRAHVARRKRKNGQTCDLLVEEAYLTSGNPGCFLVCLSYKDESHLSLNPEP